MPYRHFALTFAIAAASTLTPLSPSAAQQEDDPTSPPKQASQARLTPLADPPDWSSLAPYQNTISMEQFQAALDRFYAPNESYFSTIHVTPDNAQISRQSGGDDSDPFLLSFAPPSSPRTAPPRPWRPASALPPLAGRAALSDLHIAIDPGHIGGNYAKMEERWFQIGDSPPVAEGDLVLQIAQLLRPRLEALGAKVSLVRDRNEPIESRRPQDFVSDARIFLRQQGVPDPVESYAGLDRDQWPLTIQWQAERFFYRTAEIRARARKINNELKPDIVLALHLNAAEWGDPSRPSLVDENHLHILINGAYSAGELSYDDIRLEMLHRLLQGVHDEELAIAESLAPAMARATRLPPFDYTSNNAHRVGEDPYVWARNLLANRLYMCPVLYLEPYVMNNEDVHQRLALGHYLGRTRVGATLRSSLFEDYIDGVVEGLESYYSAARR
jgi:N-acetylmuramoyl-L-alanine amidase